MLKVAHFVTHPIQYFSPLYREITRLGEIDLRVLYGSDFGSRPSFDPGLGKTVQFDVPLLDDFRYEFLPNRGDGKPGSNAKSFDCPNAIKILATGRFDAVWIHGWGYRAQRQFARAAVRLGLPYALRGESTLLEAPKGSLRWWRRKVLSWSILRSASACLYVGQNNKAFFQSMGVAGAKLLPAHYSIDVDRFQLAAEAGQGREAVRAQLRTDTNELVIVTVAKLIERKRVGDILTAFADVGANVKLWVIGDGQDRDSLVKQADAHLGNRVQWLGFRNQSEIPSILAAADLFVLASSEETWGLVVNEAMACGLPCIVSDKVGCAADLIRDGETGFTYSCGDTKALAERLKACIVHKTILRSIGDSSRRSVREGYSVQTTASQISLAMQKITDTN